MTDSYQSDHDRISHLINLTDIISDALISTDLEFNALEWNAAAERMYGWRLIEVKGHPLNEFLQIEYIDSIQEAVIKSALEQGKWQGEVIQHHKDGTRFSTTMSILLVKDQNGNPIGFVSINRDITEHNQTEQALHESEIQ